MNQWHLLTIDGSAAAQTDGTAADTHDIRELYPNDYGEITGESLDMYLEAAEQSRKQAHDYANGEAERPDENVWRYWASRDGLTDPAERQAEPVATEPIVEETSVQEPAETPVETPAEEIAANDGRLPRGANADAVTIDPKDLPESGHIANMADAWGEVTRVEVVGQNADGTTRVKVWFKNRPNQRGIDVNVDMGGTPQPPEPPTTPPSEPTGSTDDQRMSQTLDETLGSQPEVDKTAADYMPMENKGGGRMSPNWEKATAEQVVNYVLREDVTDSPRTLMEERVRVAQERVEKIRKERPFKGDARTAQQERKLSTWQSRLDKAEQQLGKMRQAESALHEELIARQRARGEEEIRNRQTIAQLTDTVSGHVDEMDLADYVAYQIGTGKSKLKWKDQEKGTGRTHGLGGHLGLSGSSAERKSRRAFIDDKNGLWPEEYAELLYANMPEGLRARYSDRDVLNAMLDVMRGASSRVGIMQDLASRWGGGETLEQRIERERDEWDRQQEEDMREQQEVDEQMRRNDVAATEGAEAVVDTDYADVLADAQARLNDPNASEFEKQAARTVLRFRQRGEEAGGGIIMFRVRDIDKLSQDERRKIRKSLEETKPIVAQRNSIVARDGVSARNVAMEWAAANLSNPLVVNTEIGDLVINKKSISDSLAHGFGQAKLDAIPTILPAFKEKHAVYIGSAEDINGDPITDHYFAYPIDYNGDKNYVFCRTREDQNTHRLYIHEVITEDDIAKGQTLQSTALEKPRTGLPLYRKIMSTIFGDKGSDNISSTQENVAKTTENGGMLERNGQSTIQGLDGYTEDEVMSMVREDIEEKLADAGVDGVRINGMAIHGSRKRGDARSDSDLDVVVEYDGDISEDGLFNLLNDAPLTIEGVKVDINPITEGKSGTLEQYMERSRRYDASKKADSDLRFRVRDDEYADAVAAGKSDVVRKMVLDAVKQSMPDTKAVDRWGKPRLLFHGTPSEDKFYVFRDGMVFLTSSESNANQYTHYRRALSTNPFQTGRVMPCFVDMRNPLVVEGNRHLWNNIDVDWSSTPVDTEAIGDYAKEHGYDGVIIKKVRDNMRSDDPSYADVYIAFDSSQVKSAGPTYEQSKRDHFPWDDYEHLSEKIGATYDDNGNLIPLSERFDRSKSDVRFRLRGDERRPTFYSNAERAVENVKQGKATAEQWKAMLTKAGGIKAGEDKWMGLTDWLDEHKGQPLTKDEVLQFVRDNGIEMDERTYQEGVVDPSVPEDVYNDFEDYYNRWTDDDFDTPLDHLEYAWDVYCNVSPRWIRESIEPHLYHDGTWDLRVSDRDILRKQVGINSDYSINRTRLNYTTRGLANKREIAFVVPGIEPYQEGDAIHFGPENEGRAVMWVRFGETTDKDGNRVLVIDEVQSNRHQDARESGYVPKRFEDISNERLLLSREINKFYSKLYGEGLSEEEQNERKRLITRDNELAKEQEQLLPHGREDRIPDAPFEKNWMEVAMKRMLRLAAEEGFDKVAWTTGAQQAERYGIGGVVESITKGKTRGENTLVSVQYKNGKHDSWVVAPDGKVVDGGITTGENLSDLIGKELSEKVMSLNENGSISGDGLRIGGEGMSGFYDQIVPSFMRKYVKKWGSQVGDVELATPGGEVMHSVDVTEPMRDSVMQGQPLFRVRDEARQYDEQNGTELSRFVEFLERGRRLLDGENNHFHVGNTGDILNRFGISGKITVSTTAVNKRHTNDSDHLTTEEWVKAISNINNPLAITKYGNQGKSFRIYTLVQKNGKNICVGVDVNNVGRDVNVTSVRTAFARDIVNALNESLLYPSRGELERAIQEFSSRHNREIYPEQPLSGSKDSDNSSISKINEEKTTGNGVNYRVRDGHEAAVEDARLADPSASEFEKQAARTVLRMRSRDGGDIVATHPEEDGDVRFRFTGSREDFDKMRDEAVKAKGLVMPGLADKQVRLVHVAPHDFTGSRPISQAEEWAKANIVGTHQLTDSDGKQYDYVISRNAIGKFLSASATKKSDGLNAHLSVLKHLPEVIGESIEAEVHPDYQKGEDGKRHAEDGINNNRLVHRFYGAVDVDGKTYRVKTTIFENRDDKPNAPHSYEVTEIELLDDSMADGNNRTVNIGRNESDTKNRLSNNSMEPMAKRNASLIGATKLLQGVEKSYDSGKLLLDESAKTTENGGASFRVRDDEYADAVAAGKSDVVRDRREQGDSVAPHPEDGGEMCEESNVRFSVRNYDKESEKISEAGRKGLNLQEPNQTRYGRETERDSVERRSVGDRLREGAAGAVSGSGDRGDLDLLAEGVRPEQLGDHSRRSRHQQAQVGHRIVENAQADEYRTRYYTPLVKAVSALCPTEAPCVSVAPYPI